MDATTEVFDLFFHPSHWPVPSLPLIFAWIWDSTWACNLFKMGPDNVEGDGIWGIWKYSRNLLKNLWKAGWEAAWKGIFVAINISHSKISNSLWVPPSNLTGSGTGAGSNLLSCNSATSFLKFRSFEYSSWKFLVTKEHFDKCFLRVSVLEGRESSSVWARISLTMQLVALEHTYQLSCTPSYYIS